MPMRMHSSLSATMDLGLLLYSRECVNLISHSGNFANEPAYNTGSKPCESCPYTHKYCTNNLCCECVYYRLVFIGDSPLSISLYLSLSLSVQLSQELLSLAPYLYWDY